MRIEDQNLLDKPLFQCSLGDFIEGLKVCGLVGDLREPAEVRDYTDDNRWGHGLCGIMEALGCSKAQAQRIKNSGKIDQAIQQEGRMISVDKPLARQLYYGKSMSNNKISIA